MAEFEKENRLCARVIYTVQEATQLFGGFISLVVFGIKNEYIVFQMQQIALGKKYFISLICIQQTNILSTAEINA